MHKIVLTSTVHRENGKCNAEEMRILENNLLNDENLCKKVDEDINVYEDSMLGNNYSHCRNNQFDRAIFMCGVAHRKSIIEKMEKFNTQEGMRLNWIVFGN
jgi:hypothetical protein